MKILVIDDDVIFAESIGKRLLLEGFEPVYSRSGAEVVSLIRKAEKFDLVLMDLMLPEISGLKLLTIIKRHYPYKIPVIFMSSLNKAEIILSAIENGAADFFIKPFNYEILVNKIRMLER